MRVWGRRWGILKRLRGNEGRETCTLCRVVCGKPRVECLLRMTYLELHQLLLKHCFLDFSPKLSEIQIWGWRLGSQGGQPTSWHQVLSGIETCLLGPLPAKTAPTLLKLTGAVPPQSVCGAGQQGLVRGWGGIYLKALKKKKSVTRQT